MQPGHKRAAASHSLTGRNLLSVHFLSLTMTVPGELSATPFCRKEVSSLLKYSFKDERYQENINSVYINLIKAFWLLSGKKESGSEYGAMRVMQKHIHEQRTLVFLASLGRVNIKF